MNPRLAVAILSAAAIIAPTTMAFEGSKNVPYRDVGGVWTVCNGETKGIDPTRTYSDAECMGMFLVSLVDHGSTIARCLPDELPPATRAAFTDTAYNIGTSRFCRSSISAKAKAGDLKGACAAISLYVYAGKMDCRDPSNKCSGIIHRRSEIRQLCEAGLG